MKIVECLCYAKNVKENEIAVLTPYSSQKDLLLSKLGKKGINVAVQTVIESQGT